MEVMRPLFCQTEAQLPVPHDSTVELIKKPGGVEGKAEV